MNDTVNQHNTLTFSGWSDASWVFNEFYLYVLHIWQFCVFTQPVRWKWALPVHKILHGLSLSIFSEQEILKQKCLFPGGKMETFLHMADFIRIRMQGAS